jgi:ribose transport system permease protein
MPELNRNTVVVCIGLALLLAYYAYLQPMILSPFGLRALANHGVGLALATMAQLAVLIVGGIDLSVGSIIALTNCITATFLTADPLTGTLVCLGALLVGALCGAINGVLVVVSRIQPIIVTLATSYVFTGLSLYVRPSPGGSVPDFLHGLLAGSTGYLPNSILLLLAVVVLFWHPLFRTRTGKAIYAVGDSEGAAFLSGLPVVRAKVTAYAVAGLLAAAAGLFLTAETTSGDANIGSTYTLGSVAAAVLGGASLAGGRGGVIGPVVAALFISVLIGVLFAAGISTFYQNVFQGGILLAVLLAGRLHLLRENNWLSIVRAE